MPSMLISTTCLSFPEPALSGSTAIPCIDKASVAAATPTSISLPAFINHLRHSILQRGTRKQHPYVKSQQKSSLVVWDMFVRLELRTSRAPKDHVSGVDFRGNQLLRTCRKMHLSRIRGCSQLRYSWLRSRAGG